LKFSYQWICELVPGVQTEPAELQRLITMKTAECEGIEPFGVHFNSVVAARILAVRPLPKGKNKAVQIDIGGGKVASVVCGAPNVRVGALIPWVPPGTQIEGKLVRSVVFDGVESEGMLASAAELDVNRDHSGLLELSGGEPGQRLAHLKPDWIIEIDNKSLTHRPDLWGHQGMAREIAAITSLRLHDPVEMGSLPAGEGHVGVEIADHQLCPRYSAITLEGIRVEASPLWLQARLQSLGMNPIGNVVDVTNYVLAELPQPMHAFDADKLTGPTIYVRRAQAGESLEALNGETYELHPDDLVIADASGAIALAGVIGGTATAISETTTRVVLESANFKASSVRLTSARHKLRTDASMRFEKSLDPENTVRGLASALHLLRQLCPDIRTSGGVSDNRGRLATPRPIVLPVSFVVKKLGKDVHQERIIRILEALGFGVSETANGVLTVTVPTWRATKDIRLKDDLVEEIGRMIGYGEITPTAPLLASVVPYSNPLRTYLRNIRFQLSAQGFTEVHNYSFVNEAEIQRFSGHPGAHLGVRNPIASELTHLRSSLVPGLFRNIIDNVRHFHEFRIFEIGQEIHPRPNGSELPDEVTKLAAVLYNAYGDERDFFELKRVIECLFPGARTAAAEPCPYEHPTRSADIIWRGETCGRLFELHPRLLESEGIEGRAVLFDVNLQWVQQLAEAASFRFVPVRKYPTSGFDLSVVASQRLPVEQIQNELAKLAGSDLAQIEFIRQYDGPPLQQGEKSVSYHLEIGSLDHTMSSEEVSEIRNRIIQGMRELDFDLRI
jgi:phenylalanyl-tRNA synthetase beta chain